MLQKLQFKSIQARTLSTLLPIVLIVVILISLLAYQFAKQKLNEEMGRTANSTLVGVTSNINEQVSRNSIIATSLANAVGQSGSAMTMEQYAQLAERWTIMNPMTYGTGIYLASDVYNDGKTYHSVYASRDGDRISATFEYDAADYDYLNQSWYTGTLNNFDNIYYTEPELDTKTNIRMITAGKTIRNSVGQAIGVATADFNIGSIQDYVGNMNIGNVGHAVLLDHTGLVLASSQADLKPEQPFSGADGVNKQALALIESQPKGTTSVMLNGNAYMLYFNTLKDTGWKTAVLLSEAEIQQPAREMLNTLLIIGAVSLIVLTAAILWNNLGMIRQIRSMMHMSRRMANGDYSGRLQVDRRDEFGQMATEFNRILAATSQIVRKLSLQAHAIRDTSAEVAHRSAVNAEAAKYNVDELKQVERDSSTQLQATDESTLAMNEMAIGVQRIAESVQEVAEAAQQMEQQTRTGSEQLRKAVKQIDSAKLVMDESGKMASMLHERALQINGIIDIIHGINKQTTLLALNASIEAARAGEAGRGFGVVATEISNLSGHVADSTRMITEQIKAMQEETATVLAGMDNGAIRVTKGMASLQETSLLFEQIQQGVERMSAEIQEVSSASEEMSAGSEQINASLDNLAEIANYTAQRASVAAERSTDQLESLERLETSAHSLQQVADVLNELVAQFKTEAEVTEATPTLEANDATDPAALDRAPTAVEHEHDESETAANEHDQNVQAKRIS
ncbi:methyl-accepting chemotaxis protein [Paenibacillus campi]|uniref:methyl-accepting chemotaxis protein n=1 Tax=Paenibacillus campi TaxID=3106031 RepID=UPI002AFEA520|nr:methyl-accepting chemotaxis protein [Paenibacillus sp. SGZ-1014]